MLLYFKDQQVSIAETVNNSSVLFCLLFSSAFSFCKYDTDPVAVTNGFLTNNLITTY